MSRLKMAVVGVGALGRHHARILSELDNVELVAVAETNPTIGTQVAQQVGTRWVPDYRQILDAVDAVSIVVPTSAHYAVASEFLSCRIPVLVEKPLTANVAEAQAIVELAENNQTPLQVGHIERFNPATQVAARYCRQPKYIQAERLSPYAFRSTDIGVVHDLMIHDIDLILDLVAAPIKRVEAFGICIMGGHEDTVQARLTFENGCIADLTANRVNPTPQRTMQIWSSAGCVTCDFTTRNVTCYSPSEKLLFGPSPLDLARQPDADINALKADVFGKLLKIRNPAVADDDALTAELSSFVDCVVAGHRPRVNGRDALLAVEVAGQIIEAVNAHQWEGHAAGPVGPFARFSEPRKLAG